MELVIIVVLLLLLLGLFGIWRWIEERNKKNSKLTLALAYERMVMKHKLEIEHVEVFDNRIIALDRKHKKLAFLYYDNTYQQEEMIPLQEIGTSRLVEEREVKKGFIKSLHLEIALAAFGKKYLLCFYNDSKDKPTSLLSAMRRARNWKQRVDVNKNPGLINIESEYVL
ncbi:MAG TPA: hypothetical protein VD794_03960 [Flavisolibacter sp.]|nr:hypothetical protein [Flavisolibacter sp.]